MRRGRGASMEHRGATVGSQFQIVGHSPTRTFSLHRTNSFGSIDDEDPLTQLPLEVSIYIFSFLNEKQLCSASSVCRSWYLVANDNGLWREKFLRRFKPEVKRNEPQEMSFDERDLESGMIESTSGEALDGPESAESRSEGDAGSVSNNANPAGEGSNNDQVEDEEEDEEMVKIKGMIVPSTSLFDHPNRHEWKQRYIAEQMKPKIKLLRILSENTSLAFLMNNQGYKKIEDTLLRPSQLIQSTLEKYPALQLVFEGKKNIVEKKLLFIQHLKRLVALSFALLIWMVIEFFKPEFFDFPYLYIPFLWANLLHFWPLFFYAAGLCIFTRIVVPPNKTTRRQEKEIFLWSAGNSILTGVLEECGFRFLYVCTTMLAIEVISWIAKLIFDVAATLLMLRMLIIIRQAIINRSLSFTDALTVIGSGFLAALCWNIGVSYDVVYPFYEYFVLPWTNVVTFGLLRHVLYDSDHPRMVIYGMISANGGFRDSYKYKGTVSWINMWIIGFVMIHATLTYGLLLGIFLHALYDLEFVFITFVLNSIRNLRAPPDPLLPFAV